MMQFVLYLIRWQLSTPILAFCIKKLKLKPLTKVIIANLIGGCIFFWIDKFIFKN